MLKEIGERSQLRLPGHLCDIRHMSCWMDWEVSVNECDKNHTIPPCLSDSRMTHPSLPVLWWSVCFSVWLRAYLCAQMVVKMAERIQNKAHTHTHFLMYWAVISPRFDVMSGLNFHLALVPIIAISSISESVRMCVCVCVGGCCGGVVECVSVGVTGQLWKELTAGCQR